VASIALNRILANLAKPLASAYSASEAFGYSATTTGYARCLPDDREFSKLFHRFERVDRTGSAS
jgi:hypothetical protein